MIERRLGVRYVVPLREGGSLPAVVDTDAGQSFVVKFVGAGQGARALVAEVLAAGLALKLGLPVPRPAIIQLDDGFGQAEPDPEIQDILRGSVGENFGLAYLAGSVAFDPVADTDLANPRASDIVWFDAFI
ncbi:MAG TPA: HipA family kinase, partial [Chloroflexota bacterium]|nr:HipA family kinase [Chloroflexota bacterium]